MANDRQLERVGSTGQSIPSFPDLGVDAITGRPKIWRAGCNAPWIAADGSVLLDAYGWGSKDGEFVRLLPNGKEDLVFRRKSDFGGDWVGTVSDSFAKRKDLGCGKAPCFRKGATRAVDTYERRWEFRSGVSLEPVSESELAQEEPSIAAVLADQTILLAHSASLQPGYAYSPGDKEDRGAVQQLASDGNLMDGSALAAHIQGTAIVSFACTSDGSVLVGRWAGISRFLPNGEADRSFQVPTHWPGSDAMINVTKIHIYDNKILVPYGRGELRRKLLRLNRDGSVDSGFRVPDLRVDDSYVSY